MRRRAWFAAALLALLLPLAACGDSGGDTVQQLTSDTVYRPAYLDIIMNADARFDELWDARVGGDAVYFLGQRYDPGGEERSRFPILRLSLDGGPLEAVPYAPDTDAVPEGAEGEAVPAALYTGSDGALWVQEAVTYSFYDLPADFDPETQDKWAYRTGGGQLHFLRQLGPDGSELRRIDLTALAERLGTKTAPKYDFTGYVPGIATPLLDAAEDGERNLYLLMPGKLCVLDKAGEERLTLDWDYDSGSLVPLGDGSMGAFYHPNNFRIKDTLRIVDPEAGRWGAKHALNNAVEAVWPGFGAWQYLYDGGDGLYGRSAAEDGEACLASWHETAVNPDFIRRCAGLEDGRIVLLCLRNGAPEVIVLTEAGRDTLPEVETLTYAVLCPDAADWDRVNEFNRTHTDVQIVVKDYLVYAEDGSYTSQGRDQLLTELAAGRVPDIMSLGSPGSTYGSLPYRQMAEKGYFEDLLPYIDSDPALAREDLMEAPLRAAMLDGKLCLAFDAVAIKTFLGPERIVGDRIGWNLAELREAFAAMPEGSTISEYCHTKRDMLYYLVNPDDYVDWETGQCSFDSDSFRAALELADACPLEFGMGEDWEAVMAMNEEIRRRMREGLQMVTETMVYDFTTAQYYSGEENGYGEPVAFVGHPAEDGGVGSSFYPYGRLAMSSACRNKEAAWEFIRESFLPKCDMSVEELSAASYNNTMKQDLLCGFPINRADFELLREYQTTVYSEEELDALSVREAIVYQVPEEDCRQVLELYNRVEKMELGNDALFGIIEEQCGPYFAGDRTLEETIDQIQRRAVLYVNENR